MKKANFVVVLTVLLLGVFQGCAKRGTPDGGPEDITPPKFVRASPENFNTHFNSEEIRIYFNEFIKLSDAQRQIMISPPMDPRPEITPLGTASKSIRIKITDTLQENTTYAINFGTSIEDNNEGNPLPFFRYVFSTGSYIDSLSVAGYIEDAYLLAPDPFISVMLYEIDSTYTDSVVYNEPPRYITNTLDSLVTFQLDNLKEGTYQLVALRDLNNNYRFDPANEKIAFINEPINVPTDSIYALNLFREIEKFEIKRPKQVSGQHLIFGYTGIVDPDSLNIEMYPVPEDFETRITLDREQDTLHYWFKPLLERDSLQFIVSAPNYTDSLLTRRTERERDSLQISFNPTGQVKFHQDIYILPNIPITTIDTTQIQVFDKDTLEVPFFLEHEEFRNRFRLSFNKQENQTYRIQILPESLTDFFGNANDTIQSNFRTGSYSDYGNLIVNLQGVKQYPVIVQLVNEKGEVQAEQASNSESSFRFELLSPSEYYVRVVFDTNGNGQWDTGNYLQKLQPEEIQYFPEPLEVRANWDVTQLVPLE